MYFLLCYTCVVPSIGRNGGGDYAEVAAGFLMGDSHDPLAFTHPGVDKPITCRSGAGIRRVCNHTREACTINHCQ